MELQHKPYEWMVKYTPQTEWIEQRGILLWLAEVFASLGAGLFLVSLYFNSLLGLFIAWLIIVALKIPFHLAYFGKPLRFWRTMPPFTSARKASWFTRCMTFTVLFSGFGFIPLLFLFQPSALVISSWLSGTAWEVAEITFKVLAGILAFLVGIYGGFIVNNCRSIPFWNSALLPILFILSGICDGFFLMMAVGLAGGQVDIMAAEAGSRVLLIASALIMAIYLWSQTYTSSTAKQSVIELIQGKLALVFWIGIVAFGIIIPLAILVSSYFAGEASIPLLIAAITFRMLGAFALKYCLLKAGIHAPLFSKISTMQTATK